MLEKVYQIFPRLKERAGQLARTLSGGEQQMLAISRALMNKPQLLLMDEPSEGLAPIVVHQLGEQIAKLRQEGMTILLCEQNTRFSLDLSDRLYILEKGTGLCLFLYIPPSAIMLYPPPVIRHAALSKSFAAGKYSNQRHRPSWTGLGVMTTRLSPPLDSMSSRARPIR
jgi:ABC-type lipopolysaccharide export system ATPase subunit